LKLNFNFNWELYGTAAGDFCQTFVLLRAIVFATNWGVCGDSTAQLKPNVVRNLNEERRTFQLALGICFESCWLGARMLINVSCI
jgi:hypothetical protein